MSPARVVELYRAARSAISRYGDAVAARARALGTYLDDSDGSEYRRLEAEERASHAELVGYLRALAAEVADDIEAIEAYERAVARTVARTVARLGELEEGR